MLNTIKECRDTAKKLAIRTAEGRRDEVLEELVTLRRGGEITDMSLSFRDIFEAAVDNDNDGYGAAAIREMRDAKKRGTSFAMEAGGDAITTANFTAIIGQIVFADKLDAFENPAFIGDKLVKQIPATTGQQEMIPGISALGDEAENVGENEEYPVVQYNENYIMLPEILKNGFVMNITEEAIFEDKTGMILDNFGKAINSMALTQEKERLRTALGVDNSYRRNGGPIQNTYANSHTQGDGDNLIASNPLTDYTSLNAAKNAFADLVDPDTGEPIDLGQAYQVVIPDPLEWQWAMIQGATGYATQPVRAGSAVQMQFSNPINGGNRTYEALSNPWVASVVGSDTTWFIGAFQKAFVERVIYQAQVQTQDRNSDLSFARDIISRVKVRKRTRCGVKDWRPVQKHTA